jgi:RsiW-degrading membrane proteinase PrsW (M82 family)
VFAINYVKHWDTLPLSESCEQAFVAGNYELSERQYKTLLDSNILDIGNHRGYISAHFSQPLYKSKHSHRDDGEITAYYDRLTSSGNPRLHDIGLYGMGLIASNLDADKRALDYFGRVNDQTLPYLNNSYGYVLAQLGRDAEAEEKYRREIRLSGNLSAAVHNLTELFSKQARFGAIDSLMSNDTTGPFVTEHYRRQVFLSRHQFLNYAGNVIRGIAHENTPEGLAGAIAILLIWFIYFILIDIFERERLQFLIATLLLSCCSSLLCTCLYDAYSFYLHFSLNGHIVHDMLYCIFGIGLIEETVKIIPVLLIYKFTRQINESIDVLIYACISALGFAFMENLLYFQTPGLHSIAGRALSAVMMHMGLSSIAVYGFMISRHENSDKKKTVGYLTLSFAIACAVHGLYDFFIIGHGVIEFVRILSFFILIILVQIFGRMLNNGLNISIFFKRSEIARLDILSRYLTYSLSYIILLQYIVMSFKFTVENANMSLLKTAYSSWFLIFLIVASLSNFTIKKDKLFPFLAKRT